MTVTRRRKPSYVPPPNSELVQLESSSTSDSEADQLSNQVVETRKSVGKEVLLSDLPSITANSGKRAVRRFNNRFELYALLDEDDYDPLVDLNMYKNPLTRLMEDSSALQCWNDFINLSEEEQTKVLETVSKHNRRRKQLVTIVWRAELSFRI